VTERQVCASRETRGSVEVLDEIAKLRAELRLVRRAAVSSEAEPGPEAAGPTPEQVAAGAEARRIIDDALRAGRWSQDDVRAFQLHRPFLTAAELDELVQTLFVALNDGRLKADFHGTPI
jgi:hypothetical protein